MSTDRLVSIVTPAYNAQAFLPATIASVRAQTYPHWELIVVDDCSRDETRELVRAIASEEPRVRLVCHEKNGGPARARQSALDVASGRYIAFLDSDDQWLPDKLERQLRHMAEHDAAMSYTQFRRIDAAGGRLGKLIDVPERLTYRDLLCNTAIATSTVLIDRDKTGPLTMTQTYYDDYALWLGILRRGFVAIGLRADLMRYRVVGQSVSRNKLRSAKMVWRVYKDVEHLPTALACWCFARYGMNAAVKYLTF